MKVVCFDLGGVLVRITLNVAEAGLRAGVPGLPDVMFTDLACFLDYQAGRLGTEDYGVALSECLGVSVEEALAVHNHIPIEPFPGTLELIQDLNSSVITACLSNTNELHWREMLGSGRFPNVQALQVPVASHELGMEKPDPEIFEAFEQLVGVGGAEIVFFDDSYVNVAAAQSRGWQAHLIDATGDPSRQMRKMLRAGDTLVPVPPSLSNGDMSVPAT